MRRLTNKDVLSECDLICMQCGFMTRGYKDMVLHLACKQRYDEENCEDQVIKFKGGERWEKE